MDAQDAVNATYLKWTGKTANFGFTDPKAVKILGLLNHYQQTWAKERGVDWLSLYEPYYSIGTITNTNTFGYDQTTVRKFSQQEDDNVIIVWPGSSLPNPDSFTAYELVPGDRLQEFYKGYYCARQGPDLVFNAVFQNTDPEFGGKLYAPVYLYPDPLVLATDTVEVDDPYWLVTMCAAEAIRTDITRVSQYPNVLAEANELMQRMIDDNLDDQNTDATAVWNPSPWNPSGIQWWQDL